MVSLVKLADVLLVVLVVNGAASIRVRDTESSGPLMFSRWPPVKHQLKSSPSIRHQMMYHLRPHRRVPSGAMRKRFHTGPSHSLSHQRLVRPIKAPMMPHYVSMYKPTMSTPQRINFHSSPPGPNSGEYVYENPFASMAMQPNKKKVSITGDNKYTPIHTIPAPNLAYAVGHEQMVEPIVDNQLNERENFNVVNMLPPGNYHQQYQMALSVDNSQNNDQNIYASDPHLSRPTFQNIQHQYQVTEPSSDHHVVHEQQVAMATSGEQAVFAQSANQPVPVYKLSPAYDVFNQQQQPSIKPIPISLDFISGANQVLSNPVPQQQLPDTYALPISNQPQLQQHLLQQQSMMQGAPLSAYNPTYLVSQSNSLLNQHRERLFKPAPAFLGSVNQPAIDLSPNEAQPLADVAGVASAGQISQSQRKPTETTTTPDTTSNFLSSVAVSSNSFPKFERFTAQRPAQSVSNDIIFGQSNGVSQVQQPILTEQEVANYLNYDATHHASHNFADSNNQGFIASTYYQAQPDPQVEIENSRRQQLNDLTISQANAEIRERFQAPLSTATPKASAHEEHQKKLAQQFGGKQQLRIFVPDDSNGGDKKNELRRSDTDADASAEDEQPNTYYGAEGGNEVTTDGSEEYFMHDTESVDRLAMDGETRVPISSSTHAIDQNYY